MAAAEPSEIRVLLSLSVGVVGFAAWFQVVTAPPPPKLTLTRLS